LKYYEGMFVCHNKEARKETDYLAEHVRGLIEKCGGKIEQSVKWDERELSYPIKGVTRGIYFLVWYSGEPETDAKLRHEVRLSGLVLRHLTLAIEQIPERAIETASELQARLAGVERGPAGEDGVAIPALEE
jgi:small subunit ribosomal protein S6